MAIWAALIPAAVSLVSSLIGNANKRKAERERERLAASRPEIGESPYLEEQMNLARSELTRGQNTAGRVAMEEALDNDFSSSLDAILRGGGNVNNVADLYDSSTQGRMRLAMMDDDLRMQRIRNLMAVGQGAENFRQQQFQFNQYAPWADNSQAAAAAIASGNQQMWSGIANAASAAGYAAQQYQTDRMYKDYLGRVGQLQGAPVSATPYPSVYSNPGSYSAGGAAAMAPTQISGYTWQ